MLDGGLVLQSLTIGLHLIYALILVMLDGGLVPVIIRLY